MKASIHNERLGCCVSDWRGKPGGRVAQRTRTWNRKHDPGWPGERPKESEEIEAFE